MANHPAPGTDPHATAWSRSKPTTDPAQWSAAVGRVAQTFARERELDGVIAAVLDHGSEMLGAVAGTVYLADDRRRELRLAGHRGLPPDLPDLLERLAFDAPALASRAAMTREIQIVEDLTDLDPALTLAREVLERTGSRSMVAVPLFAFDRLIGVLTYVLTAHRFSAEEVAVLTTLADMFAAGVAYAQTFARERQLRSQIEAVSRASLAVSGEFNVQAVLQTIVDQARMLADADYAALGVGTDPERPFDPWVFSGISAAGALAIGNGPRPQGLLGAVPGEGVSIRLSHLVQDARYAGLPPEHPMLTSFLGVPIRYQGRSLGNLYLANKVGDEEFSDDDQQAVELLAQHAALALEHANIHAQMAGEIADRTAAEARFRQLLEAAPDAIIVADARGRITLVNSQTEQLFGYARDELRDQSVELLIPERFHQNHQGHRSGYMAAPRTRAMGVGLELFGRRKDGTEFSAEVSLSPMEADGQMSVIAAIRDVSYSKRTEQQLRRAADELTRSNAELQQFAYVASHDLQEPLRMVASFTQLLSRRYKGKLDADADEYIRYAVDGATRMQALIEDLLAYSRIGTREQPFQAVNVGEVIDGVLQTLGPAIAEANATVTRDPLPVVMADPSQFSQLFQNLVGNALKFYRDEPPRVHIGVERRGQEWRFAVQDNGIGIAPEYADRIFVIFQRLHTREEYPGTGIGLAICKKIVERHGGRIWMESEPGRGTTFFFTIPERRS